MKHTRSALASLAVAALLFTACGGSDDAASSASDDAASSASDDAASDPQQALTDVALDLLSDIPEDEGITVDEDCVRKIIGALSDVEAAAGLAALTDPGSDSEAFDATGDKIEDECFSEG